MSECPSLDFWMYKLPATDQAVLHHKGRIPCDQGCFQCNTVLKNSLNRCAFSVGFLADLATLEYVTTSGSPCVFDLIEWKDQNFFGLLFNLSAKDICSIWKKWVSWFLSLGAWNWRWALSMDYSSVSCIAFFLFLTNFITSLSIQGGLAFCFSFIVGMCCSTGARTWSWKKTALEYLCHHSIWINLTSHISSYFMSTLTV